MLQIYFSMLQVYFIPQPNDLEKKMYFSSLYFVKLNQYFNVNWKYASNIL